MFPKLKISVLTVPSKKRTRLTSCPFLDSAGGKPASPLEIKMLGSAKPPLRQGFSVQKIFILSLRNAEIVLF